MKYRYYAEGYNKSHLVYVDGFTWPSGDIWEMDKAACDTAAKRLRDKYPEVDFNVCVGEGKKGEVGDCWDRYMVRMYEMYESVTICDQLIEGIPEGDFRAKVPRVFKPPEGWCYFRAENPRGELAFFIVSEGKSIPYRVKVRGPSFCNLSVVQDVTQNMLIADLAATLGSLDVVMGEVDR